MPVALADQPVHLVVSGIRPHDHITVDSSATARDGKVWRGRAGFIADSHGVVDLATAIPTAGTYGTVDGMGLFWSMDPPSGDAASVSFAPLDPDRSPAYQVRIEVIAHGRRLADRTLTRQWLAAGATARELTLAHDKVAGELYLPAPGAPRRPPVLVLGGSEGGDTAMRFTAAVLASHGYPALCLGYFGLPGLPTLLKDVPLEYLAIGARLLAAQPGADPAHLFVMGYSSGTEAALLLAENYPDLVYGVVLYSPSASVTVGLPGGGNAWTFGDRPVPRGPIPLDRLRGPLLAIAGGDDLAWSSATAVSDLMARLDARHDLYPHQALVYPTAGHNVGTVPYLQRANRPVDRFSGKVDNMGGSRPADASAQEQSWPKVLAFLATSSG